MAAMSVCIVGTCYHAPYHHIQQPHLTPEEAAVTRRPPSTPQEAAELEAWVAARKRQWPSDTNMQRKEQEAAAKAARGGC